MSKKNKITTDCKMKEGRVVSLIDVICTVCRELTENEDLRTLIIKPTKNIREAQKDLRFIIKDKELTNLFHEYSDVENKNLINSIHELHGKMVEEGLIS
jgi:hypothetical protein